MRRILVAIAFALALSACETDTSCKDDYDCEGGLVCRVASGTCEPFRCKQDSQCDPGLTCDDNQCKVPQ